VPQAAAELVTFCLEHPATSISEPDVRLVLERLTRGPEGVFDLASPGGARLVAALIELAESDDDMAELIPLGVRGGDGLEGLLGEAVDRALALARTGTRRLFRVPLGPCLAEQRPVLEARGLGAAFSSTSMATPDARWAPTPTPDGLVFEDWRADHGTSAIHALVRAAFAGNPGVIHLPEEELVQRLASSVPKPRLLFDGAVLVGLSRTRGPEADGVGTVQMIARDPRARGRRLGDVLLSEAQRVLAEAGATRFALEVLTDNTSALALYRRHGFEVVSVETTFQRGVHG
jgi:ribosomal protein S18 acetylase RimI-like enzyme